MNKIRLFFALLLASLVASLGVVIPTIVVPHQAPPAQAAAVNCYPDNPQHTVKEKVRELSAPFYSSSHILRARLDWYKCYDGQGGFEKTLGVKWGYRNPNNPAHPCANGALDGYRVNPRSFNGVNVGSKWVPCSGYDEYRYIYLFASTFNSDCVVLDIEAVNEGLYRNENLTMTVCSHH